MLSLVWQGGGLSISSGRLLLANQTLLLVDQNAALLSRVDSLEAGLVKASQGKWTSAAIRSVLADNGKTTTEEDRVIHTWGHNGENKLLCRLLIGDNGEVVHQGVKTNCWHEHGGAQQANPAPSSPSPVDDGGSQSFP